MQSNLSLSLALQASPASGLPATPSPYAVETRRVLSRFAALGTPASEERAAILDTFLRAVVAAEIDNDLSFLLTFAAHSSAAGLVNLLNPSESATLGGTSPTFTTDRGFTGTGAGFIAVAVDPTTHPKFVRDSASAGFRSLTAAQGDGYDIGSSAGAGSLMLRARTTADLFSGRILDDGVPALTFANTDGTGFYAFSRLSAALRSIYKNGTKVATDTEASTAPISFTVNFLRRGAVYSSRQLASGFVGAGLSDEKQAALAAAELAYMQAIGAVA